MLANAPSHVPQVSKQGQLQHLLSLDDLNYTLVEQILDQAETYFDPQTHSLKQLETLKNQTVVNLFFEASTRTRSTFELAAKRLSASVLNFNVSTSATTKGESLSDTVKNLMAMQCDFFVIRHPSVGAAQFVANHLKPGMAVINAGDGAHAHPTQALLDMFTIRKHRGPLHKLVVAIVGDIEHSRVARSQIQALHLMKVPEIRVIAPKTLLPKHTDALGVHPYHRLNEGLKGVDVIMMLRLQNERMQGCLLPSSEAFYHDYGLTQKALMDANPNALIVHPGPINRNVEIQSEIADSPNAVILDQVTNGIAIRMSVMSILAKTHGLQGAI